MDVIFIIFSAIFGGIFGSFITMASYRLPRNEDLFFKSSYCTNCKDKIGFVSLVPIFSWIFQGGKCLKCKQKISIRYPLIEAITSLFFIFSYIYLGFGLNMIMIDMIFVCCLIMIVTDLEHCIMPDSMQICLLIIGLFFIYYNNIDILYSVFSALIYFLIIYVSGFIVEKWKKKEAIGGGDLKFITIAGMYLGMKKLPYFFLIAGIVGLVFGLIWNKGRKDKYFPFAPALILSFLMLLIISC